MSTILVVDDSKSIRQLVSFTLKQKAYEVIEAEDAETALETSHGNSDDYFSDSLAHHNRHLCC